MTTTSRRSRASTRSRTTIVNLVKTFPRGTFSLLTRFRANDFYTTDTRLPEAILEFTKAPIFNTSLFYAGETSAGVYTSRLGTTQQREIQIRIDQLLEAQAQTRVSARR